MYLQMTIHELQGYEMYITRNGHFYLIHKAFCYPHDGDGTPRKTTRVYTQIYLNR